MMITEETFYLRLDFHHMARTHGRTLEHCVWISECLPMLLRKKRSPTFGSQQ